MNTRTQFFYLSVTLIAGAALSLAEPTYALNEGSLSAEGSSSERGRVNSASAVFAGGCFWCIEADFEKLEGVSDVVSGYTGGSAETANYETVSYTETGHYEAVRVSYDPAIVSYPELLEYFWRQIDPTDPKGQFCDKGSSYRSAIFYANREEQTAVEASLAALAQDKPFTAAIVTETLPAQPFYLAEDYHQDYYLKNPWRYKYYRNGCGRDARLKELWG